MDGLIEQESLYEEHKAEIDKALRSQWMLWVGVLGQPIVLIIICQFFGGRIRENVPVRRSFPLQTVRIVLMAVGASLLVLSYGLRKYILSAGFKGFGANRWKTKTRTPDPEYIIEHRGRMFLPMVLSSSLSLFGFLLFFLGDSLSVFYLFAVPAVLGTLYQHPRKQDILVFLNRFLQARKSVEMNEQ